VTADDIQKVLVPLSAAFAGAFTAQNIAERNRRRDDLLKEVRSTNAAISLAFAICNAAMAMKRQHLLPMKEQYDTSRASLFEFFRERQAGEIPRDQPFEAAIDLRVLHVPNLDAGTLRAHVLDRINVAGRPLHLAVVIDRESSALCEMMSGRNAQVVEMQQAGGQTAPDFIDRYYGVPTATMTDGRYGDLVARSADSADDVIFFSQLLAQDLAEHGNRVLKRYPRRFFIFRSGGLPTISRLDFSSPQAQGMIPSSEKYADWLKAFIVLPDSPTLLQRIRQLIKPRVKPSVQKP
jgi:hypothetical protein